MLLSKLRSSRAKPAGNRREQRGRKGPLFLGTICITLGLILSKTILERTSICGPPITSRLFMMMILTSRLTLVGFGLYVLLKRPTLRIANVLLAISGTAFAIFVCALMLQVFYKPTVVSGWRSSAHSLEKNQLGFRGQSIAYSEDDFVIILLGDSQVEARAGAYGWMPECRLQFYLNSLGKRVKVFTLGAGGYGTDQELLALKEYYQQYRADLVVLWETPGNDVWNNVFPTHLPLNGYPKPTFWLEHGELRGPSETMGRDIAPSIKLCALLRWYCPADRDGKWERQYLPPPFAPMLTYDGVVSREWQQSYDRGLWSDDLSTEKAIVAMSLTPRSARMQYGLDLTRKLLHEIEKFVSLKNSKFVIFYTETPKSKYWEEETSSSEIVHILNGKYYRTSHEQYNKNLHYINQDFELYIIPATIEDWEVSPVNDHLNEHANDQVMRDLAYRLAHLITPKVKLGHVWTPSGVEAIARGKER